MALAYKRQQKIATRRLPGYLKMLVETPLGREDDSEFRGFEERNRTQH